MGRQEDLEKEEVARARLAKERAAREAEESAVTARIEQAIALKEEGNSLLKQGDLHGALQKVRCRGVAGHGHNICSPFSLF